MLWTHLISFLSILQISSSQDTNGENRAIIRPLQSNVTVTSGQKARLTCVFDRINHDLSISSTHQLIWIRQSHASYDADLILAHNQDSLISDDRLSIQRTDIDYSLVITNVNIADEGLYVCEVNTEPPQKATISLYVQVPPSIRAESTLVYSTVGKTTELRCSAIAPFDTQVYWRRLDNSTLSKFATQQRQIHNDVTQTSLYLSDLELRDFGFYVCVAESQAGQNHATIELREHHRSSMSHLLDTNEVTTSRMQILKRNKVSEPSMISVKVNSASATLFVSVFHYSCIIVVFNLT